MDKMKHGADEIVLAPETQHIYNSDEIAMISLEAVKHPFIIGYDAQEKDTILSELQKMGCYQIRQLDFANCVAVSLSKAQLKAIKTLSGVERVERDYDYKCLSMSANESDNATYLADIHPEPHNVDTIKLALLDTGVTNIAVKGDVNFVNDSNADDNGHGTQMASIIASAVESMDNPVATPEIYSVVIADHRGFAKTSTIMEAIDWAINNEVRVLNMSFGDYHKSIFLEKMVNRAASYGIIMVAAVGNDGGFADEDRIMYPAAFDNVLSVGAIDGNAIANYSNAGEQADCFAYGSQIAKDVEGAFVNAVGTSVATALVAGAILKKWCLDPNKVSADIINEIQIEKAFPRTEKAPEILTKMHSNDKMQAMDNSVTYSMGAVNARSTAETASVLSVEECCDNTGCHSDNMASARVIPFLTWQSGGISCPGNEVWYKFTAKERDAHPNGSSGWYTVHTQGSLDTIGYLYDSYGNLIAYNDDDGIGLNFNLWAQLDYYETYYIRVKAYGSNTGNFDIRVSYQSDDHGNTPETATGIIGVYEQDTSIAGHLHSQDDVDYYTFVPARNCVMEIYTEGSTDTYGRLYCADGGLLDADTNSNGNGNFKIVAHLVAQQQYYIAVSHNSPDGYGDYTLRFKFVKDMLPTFTNPRGAVWVNDSYNKDELELSVQKIIYMDGQDSVLWGEKLQQSTFISTLRTKAQQSVDELIEELLLHGFSGSFAYNMAVYIIDVLDLLWPYMNLAEFNAAYNEYVDSGCKGFVIAQCWTQKSIVFPLIPVYQYVEQQTYAHYTDEKYMYGYPYARGHFEYR